MQAILVNIPVPSLCHCSLQVIFSIKREKLFIVLNIDTKNDEIHCIKTNYTAYNKINSI